MLWALVFIWYWCCFGRRRKLLSTRGSGSCRWRWTVLCQLIGSDTVCTWIFRMEEPSAFHTAYKSFDLVSVLKDDRAEWRIQGKENPALVSPSSLATDFGPLQQRNKREVLGNTMCFPVFHVCFYIIILLNWLPSRISGLVWPPSRMSGSVRARAE